MAIAHPMTERRQGGEHWRWTREKFRHARQFGVFDPDENLELREGEVFHQDTGEPWRWTRGPYYRALEGGLFEGDERHLELLEGRVAYKMPRSRPHAMAILRAMKRFRQVFGENYTVQPQLPAQVDNHNEPEPDLMVVPGEPEDYEDHPTAADSVLLLEISLTTLRQDQSRKAEIYARAGVQDYWILNLVERCLAVRRDPVILPDGTARFQTEQTLDEDEIVTPLAAPQAVIAVKDLLPPQRKQG